MSARSPSARPNGLRTTATLLARRRPGVTSRHFPALLQSLGMWVGCGLNTVHQPPQDPEQAEGLVGQHCDQAARDLDLMGHLGADGQ